MTPLNILKAQYCKVSVTSQEATDEPRTKTVMAQQNFRIVFFVSITNYLTSLRLTKYYTPPKKAKYIAPLR